MGSTPEDLQHACGTFIPKSVLDGFVRNTSFEGVCLTTVILAPGASEGGLGAAALAPLWRDPRGSGAEPHEATLSAQAADLRAESSELDFQFLQKPTIPP